MSTLKTVAGGVLLLCIGGVVGAAFATKAPPGPVAAEPSHAGGSDSASSQEDVGAFLRRVGPTFQKASSLCFAAEQCGSIEREPKRGALASAEEIPACLKERIPVCDALAEELAKFSPPPEIASLWDGTRKFRSVRSLEHARLTAHLVAESGGSLAMTFSSKPYVDVESWVKRQQLPIAAKYATLREQAEKWQQDIMALDEWVRDHNLCFTSNVRCTLERAMEGR